jgi:hypothetical protein
MATNVLTSPLVMVFELKYTGGGPIILGFYVPVLFPEFRRRASLPLVKNYTGSLHWVSWSPWTDGKISYVRLQEEKYENAI